ncbi:trigger factor-like [Nematostella vectensis]|uniref:trigger factor-like n=1 Tax=Nematostella vectensis TaxID=45351 RepID=UPI0020776E80|nr:trigger factor-like [Nematostella vectensis]
MAVAFVDNQEVDDDDRDSDDASDYDSDEDYDYDSDDDHGDEREDEDDNSEAIENNLNDDDVMTNGVLFSLPVYTSSYGYKMSLEAHPKGECDAILEWPFRRKITLSLIDQSEQWRRQTGVIYPDDAPPHFKACFDRPIEGDNDSYGFSCVYITRNLNSGEYKRMTSSSSRR